MNPPPSAALAPARRRLGPSATWMAAWGLGWALAAAPSSAGAAPPQGHKPEDLRPVEPRPDLVHVTDRQAKAAVAFVQKGEQAWVARIQPAAAVAALRGALGQTIIAFDPPFAVRAALVAYRMVVRRHDVTVELEVDIADARDGSRQYAGRGEAAVALENLYDAEQLQSAVELATVDAARLCARGFQNRTGDPPPVGQDWHRWWLGVHYAGPAPVGVSVLWQPARTWLVQGSVNPIWPRASASAGVGWRLHWDDHLAFWLHGTATAELPWSLGPACTTSLDCATTGFAYASARAELAGHLGAHGQHRFAVEVAAQAGVRWPPRGPVEPLVRPYGGVSYHYGL